MKRKNKRNDSNETCVWPLRTKSRMENEKPITGLIESSDFDNSFWCVSCSSKCHENTKRSIHLRRFL